MFGSKGCRPSKEVEFILNALDDGFRVETCWSIP